MSYEIDGVRLVDDVGNVYDIEEWLDMHGYVELPRDANGITDELREWWVRKFPVMDKELHKDFTAIADRIDAAHKKAMSEQPCTIDMVPMTDERMAEHGWVRLPVDANGEYVNIGDVMVYADGNTCPMKVVALVPPSVFLTDDGPRYADMCRHYKPTVVDVLREFGDWYAHTKGGCDEDGIIAEYAAMFQLKENA